MLLSHSVSHTTVAFSKYLLHGLHGYLEFYLIVYSCTEVIMALNLAMVFLAVTLKAQSTKEKIDKLDFIKIKTLCSKGYYQKVKNNHRMGKNICK